MTLKKCISKCQKQSGVSQGYLNQWATSHCKLFWDKNIVRQEEAQQDLAEDKIRLHQSRYYFLCH